MNKKDQMTVENFVSTGMELETLYTCFPDFSKEEIAEIYNNYKENQSEDAEGHTMSINCSQYVIYVYGLLYFSFDCIIPNIMCFKGV